MSPTIFLVWFRYYRDPPPPSPKYFGGVRMISTPPLLLLIYLNRGHNSGLYRKIHLLPPPPKKKKNQLALARLGPFSLKIWLWEQGLGLSSPAILGGGGMKRRRWLRHWASTSWFKGLHFNPQYFGGGFRYLWAWPPYNFSVAQILLASRYILFFCWGGEGGGALRYYWAPSFFFWGGDLEGSDIIEPSTSLLPICFNKSHITGLSVSREKTTALIASLQRINSQSNVCLLQSIPINFLMSQYSISSFFSGFVTFQNNSTKNTKCYCKK